MTRAETQSDGGARDYLKAMVWMLILMVLKVAAVVIPMSRPLMVSILMFLMVGKVYIITAYFMHLKWETKGLVVLVFFPVSLALLLAIGAAPDFVLG